jgi:hypothetical protein
VAVAPKLCPGGTVVCIGGGPSLTPDDVDYCCGKATVIAVNDAYRLAPWADALFAADLEWWNVHKGVPGFAGLKFGFGKGAARWGVNVMRNTGDSGIEMDPTGLRTGRNSGAAAVNLAVHFGASRILLLGYDMQAKNEKHAHWFGAHKAPLRGNSPYYTFRQVFDQTAKSLKKTGVSVINCSRETALTCFPRVALREALK